MKTRNRPARAGERRRFLNYGIGLDDVGVVGIEPAAAELRRQCPEAFRHRRDSRNLVP
jgi:hypothetical protein